jgi:hypothetical protein
MALRSCLYCGVLVSEAAVDCPSCKTFAPLDTERKIAGQMQVREEEEKEKEATRRAGINSDALQKKYRCLECQFDRTLGSIFRDSTCPECGYPDNRPKCRLCKESSVRFDPTRESLVCSNHYIEICTFCNKPIENGKKYFHDWTQTWCGGSKSGTSVYHSRCWTKKGGGCLWSFAIFLMGSGYGWLR